MKYMDELEVGQSAESLHIVTDALIQGFAEVSSDRNPLHLDDTYAATTPFKGRIAHGLLSASFISALLGNTFPGEGSIYLSQSLEFLRPVRPGDEVRTRVEITAIDAKKDHITLSTTCSVGRKAVIRGEAVVLAPRRPVST